MDAVNRVWACVACPCNGVCHEVDSSPCDACSGSEKSTQPRPVPRVDQMMSFLAMERGLTLLSHWVGIIGTPPAEELFHSEAVRTQIQSEWNNLKDLMEGAGFE